MKSHDWVRNIDPEKAPEGTQFIVLYRDDPIEQSDAMMRFFHQNTNNTSGAYLASYTTVLTQYFDTFTKKWCSGDHPVFKYSELLDDPVRVLTGIARIVFPEFDTSSAVLLAIQSEEGGISRRNTIDTIMRESARYFLDLESKLLPHDCQVPDTLTSLVPPLNDKTDDIISHGVWRRYPFMRRLFGEHAQADIRTIPLWTPSLLFVGDLEIEPLANEALRMYPDASHAAVWLLDVGCSVQKYTDCRKQMALSPIRIIVPLSGSGIGSVSVGDDSLPVGPGQSVKILTNHVPFGIQNTGQSPLIVLVLDYRFQHLPDLDTDQRVIIHNQFDDVYEQNMHEWGITWSRNSG